MPQPQAYRVSANNISFNVYEWPGQGSPFLFVHATGFHARCWDQIIAHLPNKHIFAVDLRSHGLSDKTEPPYHWDLFAEDICALVEALDLRDLTAVGHSLGGYMVTYATGRMATRFKQLILLDPVIVAPEVAQMIRGLDGAHPVEKRRARWPSSEAMFEQLRNKNPYARWDPGVLHDYCQYALIPSPSLSENGDEYALACPPHMEAAIYVSTGGEKIFDYLDTIKTKVRLIRARERNEQDALFAFDPSPTWDKLGELLVNSRDSQLADYTHFFPMEIPQQVAQWILEVCE